MKRKKINDIFVLFHALILVNAFLYVNAFKRVEELKLKQIYIENTTEQGYIILL